LIEISRNQQQNQAPTTYQIHWERGDRVQPNWDPAYQKDSKNRCEWGFVVSVLEEEVEVIWDRDHSKVWLRPDELKELPLDAEGFIIGASLGFLKPIKCWVQSGGDVNVVVHGYTALYIACDEGQVEIMEYLVEEANAMLILPNPSGIRAFDMAFLSGHASAMGYAMRYRPNTSSPGLISKEDFSKEFIRTLWQLPVEVELGKLCVMRSSDFFAHKGNSLTYSFCSENQLLIPVDPQQHCYLRTVFVIDEEDPNTVIPNQKLLYSFLEEHPDVEYVFRAESCMPPLDNKAGILGPAVQVERLLTLTTALFMCSHCLILPYPSSPGELGPQQMLWVVNLSIYFSEASRFWFLVMGMLSGCRIFCPLGVCQMDESSESFVELFSLFEANVSDMIKKQPFGNLLLRMLDNSGTGESTPSSLNKQSQKCLANFPDPIQFLSQASHIVLGLEQGSPAIQRVLSMEVTTTMLPIIKVPGAEGSLSLADVAALLGKPSDQLLTGPQLNAILIALFFAMDRLPASAKIVDRRDATRSYSNDSLMKNMGLDAAMEMIDLDLPQNEHSQRQSSSCFSQCIENEENIEEINGKQELTLELMRLNDLCNTVDEMMQETLMTLGQGLDASQYIAGSYRGSATSTWEFPDHTSLPFEMKQVQPQPTPEEHSKLKINEVLPVISTTSSHGQVEVEVDELFLEACFHIGGSDRCSSMICCASKRCHPFNQCHQM